MYVYGIYVGYNSSVKKKKIVNFLDQKMTALKLATKHLYHAANQHLSLPFDTLFFYFELHDIRINVELNYAWIIEAFV